MKVSNWWLVRHAPVPSEILYGQLDVAAEYADEAAFNWLRCQLPREYRPVSSDLSRCVNTLEKLTAVKPLLEAGLREQNFGRWQGLTYPQIEALDPEFYKEFWQNPAESCPPEGESFQTLLLRAGQAFDRLRAGEVSADTLIVAHAGSIRAILAKALGLLPHKALELDIAPLSLSKLTVFEDNGQTSWKICWVNRVAPA